MTTTLGTRVGPLYVMHTPARHGVLWALTIGPVVYTFWICAMMIFILWWVCKWSVLALWFVIQWTFLMINMMWSDPQK